MKIDRAKPLPDAFPAKPLGKSGRARKTPPIGAGRDASSISGSGDIPPRGSIAPARSESQPVEVTPLIVEGKLVPVSKHGNNAPVLGYAVMRGKNRKVVFKQEINSRSDDQAMLNDHIKAVVASRIMKKLGAPTVLYYPARMQVGSEPPKEGIISEYIDCQNLYEDPSLLEKITNPDDAVRASIVSAWLGNSDAILNEGNVWVRPDGKAVFGDYGYAFRHRVTALGLPKTNLKLMERYATKENVEPIVHQIASLTYDQIHVMVEEAGKSTWGWNKAIAREITDKLVNNRNELRQHNPFACFYEGNRAQIQIENHVMSRLREELRYRADISPTPDTPPENDEPYFIQATDDSGKPTALMLVKWWQIPDSERDAQRRLRREISSAAKNIPDWNKEVENQLMVWILFSNPDAKEYFKSSSDHFYPLLKFMKNFFFSEEILGHSLGIV